MVSFKYLKKEEANGNKKKERTALLIDALFQQNSRFS